MTDEADLLHDFDRDLPLWRAGLALLTAAVTASLTVLGWVVLTDLVLAAFGFGTPRIGLSFSGALATVYYLVLGFAAFEMGGVRVAKRLWLTPAERRAAE